MPRPNFFDPLASDVIRRAGDWTFSLIRCARARDEHARPLLVPRHVKRRAR